MVEEGWIERENFSLPSAFYWDASKSFHTKSQSICMVTGLYLCKREAEQAIPELYDSKGEIRVTHTVSSANQGVNHAEREAQQRT